MSRKAIIIVLALALIPTAFFAGLWLRHARPWETAEARAFRICGECGLSRAETGRLIDDAMTAIERDNPALKGVLPKDYAHPCLAGFDLPTEFFQLRHGDGRRARSSSGWSPRKYSAKYT